MISLKRSRRWHRRKVLSPWPIKVEFSGRGQHFLETLEARWSQSQRCWLWRMPAVAAPVLAD